MQRRGMGIADGGNYVSKGRESGEHLLSMCVGGYSWVSRLGKDF